MELLSMSLRAGAAYSPAFAIICYFFNSKLLMHLMNKWPFLFSIQALVVNWLVERPYGAQCELDLC